MKIIFSLALILTLSACGSAGGIFTRHDVVTPQVVETLTTNKTVIVIADPAGSKTTNVSEIVTSSLHTNAWTNSTYTVSEGSRTWLEGGAAIAGAVPSPWGGVSAAALALLSASLGIVAKIKSDKAAILPAIIRAVEVAKDPKLKDLIRSHASAAGVEVALNRAVKKITER